MTRSTWTQSQYWQKETRCKSNILLTMGSFKMDGIVSAEALLVLFLLPLMDPILIFKLMLNHGTKHVCF